MISYKQYKAINEAVMPSFTLGLANPSNMGLTSPFASFAEAKKKMFGDKESDDETGDGEMVKPSSEKDDPDVDVDMGEEGDCGCNAMSKKTSKKTAKKASKKKMWSDEDDAPEVEDEEEEDADVGEGDEEIEDDDMGEEDDQSGEVLAGKGGMKNGPVAGGPMFSKKSKKKMCGDEDKAIEDAEEDLGKDLDGDNEEGESEEHKEKVLMSKKTAKKQMKKEETEEDTWWTSVKNMIGPTPDTKYNDGWTEYQTEDGFKVENPQEPKAGEIGFAPQGKIGSFFSN